MRYHWGLGVGHLYTRIPGLDEPIGVASEQLIAEHTGDLDSIPEPCGPEESALAGEIQQVNASRNLDSSMRGIDCNVSCTGGLRSEEPHRRGQGSTLGGDLQNTSLGFEERLQQVPPITSPGRDRGNLLEDAEQGDTEQSGFDIEGDRDSINLGDEESDLELRNETEEELGLLEDMFGVDALYDTTDLFSYD
jgi:hypothetical protein